jgi:glycosyltransferase involved in cell wall biosynthesis
MQPDHPTCTVLHPRRVLLLAPSPPPYGGMALQARQLEKLLRGDGNSVVFISANAAFPEWLQWLDYIPGLCTILRAAMIWLMLCQKLRHVEVVHILAASWLYFFSVVFPAVITSRVYGKRTILNYRGGQAAEFFAWWGWLAKPIFEMATVVTAPSDFLVGIIRARFHVPVLIVPNILNTSAFKYRQRTVFQPKMLAARHLEKIYDIESVVKAFRAVQEHYPEASLLIAGTGSQEEHLESIVSAWRLKNVQFLGRVEHEHLAAIYDKCDILLNASTIDNFPGALLEASAAGLVVVSTCSGGIPFIYEDQKTALLVPPGDWQGLAAAVEKVLQNRLLAQSLTANAAALAQACDWTAVRTSLYSAYGSCFAKDEEPVLGATGVAP